MKEFIEKARFYVERIPLKPKEPPFRLKNYNFTDDQDEENKKIMVVAECLKSIDETLKDDFFTWGSVRYSQHLLEAIWDLVPPVSCDVYFYIILFLSHLLFLIYSFFFSSLSLSFIPFLSLFLNSFIFLHLYYPFSYIKYQQVLVY